MRILLAIDRSKDAEAATEFLGARGLGGMARLLLGSVSEKVLRDARGPLLIVKGSI